MSKFDPRMISKGEGAALKQSVLIDQQYLGSSMYEYIAGNFDNHLYHLLFDGHSRSLYEREGQRPSIIIGRRGSGKSTYLNHLSQKAGVFAIPVKTWDFIDLVEVPVRVIMERQGAIDAEKCADIWQLIFLVLIALEKRDYCFGSETVRQFVSEVLEGDVETRSLNYVTAQLMRRLRDSYINQDLNFDMDLCLNAMTSVGNSLDELEDMLSRALMSHDKIAIFMLDNPERFNRTEIEELSSRFGDQARDKTIAGLLNLVGRMNKGNIGVQIRLCVPSEQFFYLQRVSSAKKKDFGSSQLLHWSSGEILSMAAHRFMVFLSVYPDFRSNQRYRTLLDYPIYTRNGAIKFWREVFENDVVNGRGKVEDTLTYLLRHTQLVPRQLLDFLNKAVNLEIQNGSQDLSHVSADSVIKAITDIEFELSSEVIDSYSYSYPEANEMFDIVLPSLPVLTTAKAVKDNLYKSTDAKAVLARFSGYSQVTPTKDRFLRMLVETGVYGKIKQERQSRGTGYVIAEFEYTISGNLKIDDRDDLAMHPLFSGQLSPNLYACFEEEQLGVYPVGTDCEM